ncbi:class I SAM-dependent methyltransferase [Reichenbachiella sp. MALMAid0571]|uniref:class I SAM-dependent methyltransferase n=1 Tax=Reichenbachiella sp. MALMAid0571 TaxID=3143939 RepID=UPI0032DFE8F4
MEDSTIFINCQYMNKIRSAHSDSGMKGILKFSWAYSLFSDLISDKSKTASLMEQLCQINSKSRILDIGCGPGSFVKYLPKTVDGYLGIDMNENYIEYANDKWSNREDVNFIQGTVGELDIRDFDKYDVVVAKALVHHLSDEHAKQLFSFAAQVLNQGGIFVTYDNVFIENQHWFAKWLIKNDRGKYVRTQEEYTKLVALYFNNLTTQVLHDTLRIPYTILTIRCSNN